MSLNPPRRWPAARYATLAFVLLGHAVLIAALLLGPIPGGGPQAPSEPMVQLLALSPPNVPLVKAPDNPVRQFAAGSVIAPPLHLASTPPAGDAADATHAVLGDGNGVDWTLEARRAVQAFDIRTRRPVRVPATTATLDDGWVYTRHQPGDGFKTPEGDWIVWIDADCYQVASAARPGAGGGAMGPQGRVYCVKDVSARTSSTK